MEGNTILTVIGGLAVLALIIIAIVIRFRTKQSTDGKEKAKEFLNGLTIVFQTKMIEIVNNFDFTSFNSLEEAEASILSDIYESLWQYVSAELEQVSKEDILVALSLKVLNKDFVSNFISGLIEENKISEKIEESWTRKVEQVNIEAEKNDIELQNEFSNPDLYNEEVDKSELPIAEVVEEPEEEEEIGYPDTDYDPESDNSVELIGDVNK